MPMVGEFSRFLLVGATATAIQYLVLHGLVTTQLSGPVAGSAVGYVISTIFNYFANYRLTFHSSRPHWVTFPRFSGIAVAGLALNSALMALGTRFLGLHYLLAQVLTTSAVIAWNYLANRWWAFGVVPPKNVREHSL